MCYVHQVKKYEAVIFDWHDTLLEYYRSVWDQDKYVAATHFGVNLQDEEIASHWGRPAWELLPAIFRTDMPVVDIVDLLFACRDKFPRSLFPDTIPLLGELYEQGIVTCVVTGGTRKLTSMDIQRTGFPMDKVASFQYSEDTPHIRHRSDPRVLAPTLGYLAKLGIGPGQTLGVGDHINDFNSFDGAGVEFVGITTGLISAEEFTLAGTRRTVSQLSELRDIIYTP